MLNSMISKINKSNEGRRVNICTSFDPSSSSRISSSSRASYGTDQLSRDKCVSFAPHFTDTPEYEPSSEDTKGSAGFSYDPRLDGAAESPSKMPPSCVGGEKRVARKASRQGRASRKYHPRGNHSTRQALSYSKKTPAYKQSAAIFASNVFHGSPVYRPNGGNNSIPSTMYSPQYSPGYSQNDGHNGAPTTMYSPHYRPAYGQKGIPTTMYSPQYRPDFIASIVDAASTFPAQSPTSPQYTPAAAYRMQSNPAFCKVNSEADASGSSFYQSPTSPKYTPTSPTFCMEATTEPGSSSRPETVQGLYSPSYSVTKSVLGSDPRAASETRCSSINETGPTSRTKVDSASADSSTNPNPGQNIKRIENKPIPTDPRGSSCGKPVFISDHFGLAVNLTASVDSNVNPNVKSRAQSTDPRRSRSTSEKPLLSIRLPAHAVDEHGCQRLAYDPTQPQYSPTYDPDPTNSVVEGAYHPCWPKYND